MKVELGKKYRDPVSGWSGTATAIHTYLWGCRRVTIEGSDKDGKPESFTFDEPQLQAMGGRPTISVEKVEAQPATGGPRGTTRGRE